MASLITNYTELQFTKKSWEFVSDMENFPFDKLPQKGSGSRGTWTMKDVKTCLPKPTKKNPYGIFASKAAKELFEKSKLSEDLLENPSSKNGFTTKDVRKILPKEKKFFASQVAEDLAKASDLEIIKEILQKEKPKGKSGLYSKAEVEQALLKKALKKED